MLRFFRLVFALPRLSLLFLVLGVFGGAASLAFANPPTTRPFSPPSERPSLGTSQTAQQRRIADEKARRAKDPLVRRIQQIGGSLASSLIQHGLDPDNPWMLAHMLLAFGKDLRMPDGKLVIERIVESALQFRKIKGQKIPYFPKGDDSHGSNSHPFMSHQDHARSRGPWDYRFKVHGQSVTLGQLHQGLVQSFLALNEHQIPEFAWAFDAMYGRLPNQKSLGVDQCRGRKSLVPAVVAQRLVATRSRYALFTRTQSPRRHRDPKKAPECTRPCLRWDALYPSDDPMVCISRFPRALAALSRQPDRSRFLSDARRSCALPRDAQTIRLNRFQRPQRQLLPLFAQSPTNEVPWSCA